jgi:hypothetical protein
MHATGSLSSRSLAALEQSLMVLTALRALHLEGVNRENHCDAEGVAVLGRVLSKAMTALRTLELRSETLIFGHAFLYARVLEKKCSIVNVCHSRCRLHLLQRLCCILFLLDST